MPLPVPRTLYDFSQEELAATLDGEQRYRVDQLWHGLYEQLADVAELTTLPKALRQRLATELPPALAPVAESTSRSDGSLGDDHDEGPNGSPGGIARDRHKTAAHDGRGDDVYSPGEDVYSPDESDGDNNDAADDDTVKWLFALPDGVRVETVLMHYRDRSTVCVSTQAGCAMACGFCATGQAGFERHLSTGEIVEQVVRAARRARQDGRRLGNVVFMGMGEPLANYDRVWPAVERIHGSLGLSARHLTLSTVGVVPGIRRLADASLPVNLAVSLHAANDSLRDELVPLNRRYPLAVLLDACADYLRAKGRRLSIEWALIDGTNDRRRDATELADLTRSLPLAPHVNLIPLNPTPGWPTRGTPPGGVRRFQRWLTDAGVNATVRRNRGTDIDAACGQLAARVELRPSVFADSVITE